jgi:hypothetical protein
MHSLAQMRERYSALVSIVARRLESLGRDPAEVLIASPEYFELAAVTVPGQPVMFAMYVETALQSERPIELLADRFVGGWLRQTAIDEARQRTYPSGSATALN